MTTDSDYTAPVSYSPLGSTLTLGLSPGSNWTTSMDPEVAELLEEIRAGRAPRRSSWASQVGILALSLLFFVGAGFLTWSVRQIVLLVVVLFLHEAGHYLAMKKCGYRDVRMFFIPMFGAAVSGSAANAAGYQRTLVALAGPMPGIVLGIALAFVYRAGNSPLVGDVARMLIGLNAFNLLPLFPLDGGRVLQETLFCRRAWLEATFTTVAGLGFLGLMWAGGELSGPALAVVVFLSWRAAQRTSRIAARLRESGESPMTGGSPEISMDFLVRAVREVQSEFTENLKPKQLVGIVRTVLDKLAPRPPRALATVLLLSIYLAGFFAAAVGAVLMVAPFCPPGQQLLTYVDASDKPTARGCFATAATGERVLEGRWEYFNADGTKVGEAIYRHGVLLPETVKKWDEAAQPPK